MADKTMLATEVVLKTGMFGKPDIRLGIPPGGFEGSIDIEGYHDPVYRGELEMTGQVAGLNYLKRCRADFVENP